MFRIRMYLARLSQRLSQEIPLYRRIERKIRAGSVVRNIDLARAAAVSVPLRAQPLRAESIVADLETNVQFWWLDDVGAESLRLGAAAADSQALLDAALSFAVGNALAVHHLDRARRRIENSEVRELREFLLLNGYVWLVFSDLRSSYPAISVLVEAWPKDEAGNLAAPLNNAVLSRFWTSTTSQLQEMPQRFQLEEFLGSPVEESVPFEIDWVFTYVDGTDPDWQELFAEHAPARVTDASDRSRFVHREDLKFALRSLDVHAPWIRKIHIVSNCRAPAWLNVQHDRINWVNHEEIIAAEHLPTFSSHAIETALHRIPGLAEHWVYSNDDFYLLRNVSKSDFFHSNGIARLRLEAFGTVVGRPADGEPDYLNGARNAAELLRRDFGRWPVRLHTHSPQSMSASVLSEMEERYPEEFRRTRANKFRHPSDVAVTGFFYHHYAFMTGRAVADGAAVLLVQQNHRYKRVFDEILERRANAEQSPFLSVCVNDGRGSDTNDDWQLRALEFLNLLLPETSEFEVRPVMLTEQRAGEW